MKATIDKFLKRLYRSLGHGPLLNVHPGRSRSRVDFAEFSSPGLPPFELLSNVLFSGGQELLLGLQATDEEGKGVDSSLEIQAIAQRIEKDGRFISRETGLHAVWLAYPIAYLQNPAPPPGKPDDILAPVYLWPVELAAGGMGFGKIRLRSLSQFEGPVFNGALAFWIASRFLKEVKSPLTPGGPVDLSSFKELVGNMFSEIGLETVLSDSLAKLQTRKDLRKKNQSQVLNSAVLGVIQWHNRELMEDLRRLRKIVIQEGALQDNLVEKFLSGEGFSTPPVEIPPENDRYLALPTDYTQEMAIWRARSNPGVVVHGPPGTGKSQTIVNIVTDALAHGERVLILSQKRAAVDVVGKRLNQIGLEDFFVAVHDPESERKSVISKVNAIRANLKAPPTLPGEDTHKDLSNQIVQTEKYLDTYIDALYRKKEPLGLSYRQVVTTIRQIHDKNPIIKPDQELADLLSSLDKPALDKVVRQIRTAAEDWLTAQPLRNPWRHMREGVEIENPFVLQTINNLLAQLLILDEKHSEFVSKNSKGCTIDADAGSFIEDGGLAQKLILENKKVLSHVLRWSKGLGTHGLRAIQQIESVIRGATLFFEDIVKRPYNGDLHKRLASVDGDKLSSFLKIISEIGNFKGKRCLWLRPKFRDLRSSLDPLLKLLNEPFSFDPLDDVKAYMEARSAELAQREALSEVFQNSAEDMPAKPPEELLVILETKRRALTICKLLLSTRESYVWANDAWEAARNQNAREFQDALNAFLIGLKRATKFESLFSGADQLKEWLNDEYTESIMAKVRNGQSISEDLTALRNGLQSARTIKRLLNKGRWMEEREQRVLDFLEGKYRQELERGGHRNVWHQENWGDVCILSAYDGFRKYLTTDSSLLSSFDRADYDSKRKMLKELLERKQKLVVKTIRGKSFESRKMAASHHEWRTLLALAGRGSKRLRQIVRSGAAIGLFDLLPCWMMNPNSASRLFPWEARSFDLVIFDEASQCPIEQAIPAIYRAKRIVVAGDRKQLPPTSFFQAAFDWDETEKENQDRLRTAEQAADEESYDKLMAEWGHEWAAQAEDLLQAAEPLLPEARLDIHYRSRYRELIEFSNHAFYGGRLQAAPNSMSEVPSDFRPISFRAVNGVYKDQTNPDEAKEIVGILEAIFQRQDNPTIGIVTFNQAQADLIDRELERYSAENSEFRTHYSGALQRKDDGLDVGLFVKNLENVQGDERDVMIFSTTFGKGPDGQFRRYFGPLNTQVDGPRRLNVAISRARTEKIIVTSMPLDEISPGLSPNPSGHMASSGRDFLQVYMRYAQAVSDGHPERIKEELDLAGKMCTEDVIPPPPDDEGSPFEDEVYHALRQRFRSLQLDNLEIDRQVGAHGFRIDLAVRSVDSRQYLLGIECDGKTYHSSPTARFRDIWRQGILESYGWKIHRIWSHYWWSDSDREIDEVVDRLRPLL